MSEIKRPKFFVGNLHSYKFSMTLDSLRAILKLATAKTSQLRGISGNHCMYQLLFQIGVNKRIYLALQFYFKITGE